MIVHLNCYHRVIFGWYLDSLVLPSDLPITGLLWYYSLRGGRADNTDFKTFDRDTCIYRSRANDGFYVITHHRTSTLKFLICKSAFEFALSVYSSLSYGSALANGYDYCYVACPMDAAVTLYWVATIGYNYWWVSVQYTLLNVHMVSLFFVLLWFYNDLSVDLCYKFAQI